MADEEHIVKTETHLTEESPVKFTKAEKKSGKRIGFNYVILKSLKESKKNDVVKCLYIKSLFDFGICVIKEGTYGDIKDSQGRDIKDRLMWQRELHEMLQKKLRVPRLLGSFEENGNFYLVIERIKGIPLANYFKDNKSHLRNDLIQCTKEGLKCLDYLEQVATILSKLHEQKIVHRDVSANNFIITPRGKIAVIDLELSYSLERQFPSPPFMLGTRGYMSPEQEAASKFPSEKEDIYSLGIIILQAWCTISPIKLNNTDLDDVKRKIPFLIPDEDISDVVIACLDPDPLNRPNALEVRNVIQKYLIDSQKKISRRTSQIQPYTKEEIIGTIQLAINTFGSPVLLNLEKGWFSDNIRAKQPRESDKLEKSWYASFGVGAAGIIYFLSRAKSAGFDITPAEVGMVKSWDLINNKYEAHLEKSGVGLFNGSDGVAAVIRFAIESGLLKWEEANISWMNRLLEREAQQLNLLNGLAGQGIANLLCHKFLPNQAAERLNNIVNRLIETQLSDGSWIYNNKCYKGFHGGVSGIVYFLLEVGKQTRNENAIIAAERALQWLIREAKTEEGAFYWLNHKGTKLLPILCEGLVGIGYTFIKAFQILKDPVYQKYGMGCLDTGNLLQGELSQCHGLCGLGEVYLDAFEILEDERWLEKVDQIAQVVLNLKKMHRIHGPYWLVGSERQPVGNFLFGNSGVLHFLLRYCFRSKFSMPLLFR